MSGVEVILGVIPLLFEVAEYSHTVYQQFKRWRKYDSELEDFQNQLCCYQSVFRTDCKLLLRAVTTSAEYERIMEHDATQLKSPELERNLRLYLNDQYDCCGKLMERIKRELYVLATKSQRFQDAIARPDSASSEGIDKRALRSLRAKRAKAEFIMTGQALNKRLATLEKHRDTFHIILEQARIVEQDRIQRQIHSVSKPNLTDTHSLSAPDNSILLRITSVQIAANKLHNTLLDSCTAHNESSLYLRLKTQHKDGTEPGTVIFDLRLHPISRDGPKSSSLPSQSRTDELAFDKSNTRHTKLSTQPLRELSNLRKRRRQSLSILSDKRVKTNHSENRVPQSAFALRNVGNDMNGLSIRDDTSLENISSTESPLTWYSSNEGRGEQTRAGMHPSHLDEWEEHLELARTARDLGHEVILDATPFDFSPPTTLAEHISNWPPINYNQYLPHEVLFLAKHIASSVLHFHETPLLQENWTSQCIALLDAGAKSMNKRRTFADPHLKVLISHQLKQDSEFEPATFRPRADIRNPYTFTLGIILIELAHQTPWATFERPK